jgi:hypothetical protein
VTPTYRCWKRALDQNLSSQRDVGVQLWGDVAGGIVQYTIGIFNGAADTTGADTDLNHAKDIQGRLFVQPFKTEALSELGNLGVGVAVGTGNRKGAADPRRGCGRRWRPSRPGSPRSGRRASAPSSSTSRRPRTRPARRRVHTRARDARQPAALLLLRAVWACSPSTCG